MKEDAGTVRLRIGIAAKLAVCLLVSGAAILATLGYINLHLHRKQAQELILTSAERLSDIILQSTRHEMMRNDREALYNAIGDIGKEPGIQRIRIFNKEGRISFSTDAEEVGRVVDKQAEACYACHAQGVPLERLNRPDSARIFPDSQNHRVLGMIRPIRNEPGCASAACHAHPAGKKVLGVIDVHLSLAAVDQQSALQQSLIFWLSAGGILLLCAVSGGFVWAVLHRPIHDLIAGTHRVAGGDMSYRLVTASNDELGELARSFNRMTADLDEAHAEITRWNRELETRVEKKTEQLEQAYNCLAGSEKMASIGKLAATVAHEVNNPLFGILTYARLCLKELDKPEMDPAARERVLNQLRIIERESRRCGDIMKNLLTYARQAPQRRDLTDVNVIIDRAVTLVRHQFSLQEITLQVNLQPDLPQIVCDAGQVQQVVLILLANAAEATGTGGQIWLTTQAQDSRDVIIRVRDNGAGIPPQIRTHIFDAFFTTKEDQLRTGLGLAVAKSIVEQHGGLISVQSTPSQGAEFVVTLPAAADERTGVSPLAAAVGLTVAGERIG
jgi:two-component system NtrC family sensor kinase